MSRDANLKLKLSKCQFFITKGILFLSKVYNHYLKVSLIKHIKEPSNVKELQHSLGMTGYYRKCVPLFANITKPFNKLLRKDTKFQWIKQCQGAFEHLKLVLCREPILQYSSMEKSFHTV